jgi:DNA polymerase-3 subunit gamma/tau
VAYLVLARKYRPEQFAEMIGQEHVTRTLSNAIRDDRVHHAYLFCGVRGLGKTTAARILAKCLVCETGPTSEPCNACEQCVAVNEARSVDVIEIDGASNNKVEHVRSLREQVNYLPQSARRKVYIIDEVHMLTDSAFNALLKTLEEPPPHVTFIFATTDPHKVLPTILSRVSRLDFRTVRTKVLVDHLRSLLEREGITAEDDALHLVAQSSEGSVRDALTLLDKVIAFAETPSSLSASEVRLILGHADRFAIADLLDAVFARDAKETVSRFDDITRSGSDLLQLAIGVLQHLRDLTVVKLCGTREVLLDVSDALYERLEAQAKGIDAVILGQHFDRFSRVLEGLETSQIPRLSIEMGLLDLVNAEPLMPMGDLVARLRDLSGGGESGAGGSTPNTPKARSSGSRGAQSSSAAPPKADAPAAASAPAAAPKPAAAPTPKAPPPQTPSVQADAALPPPPSGERAAALPDTAFAKELWGMVSDSFDQPPGGAPPQIQTPPARDFQLTPPTQPVQVEEPTSTEDAGCPSSRCTPREPIAWRQLEPFPAWEALLDRIRERDDLLFAVLGELGLSQLTEGVLELAAAKTSFARDQLSEHPELRASLHQFMDECFGESFELRLVDAAPSLPDLPSLVLLEQERVRKRQADVEAKAQQNPRIRALLSAFNGELRNVSPVDASPAEPS